MPSVVGFATVQPRLQRRRLGRQVAVDVAAGDLRHLRVHTVTVERDPQPFHLGAQGDLACLHLAGHALHGASQRSEGVVTGCDGGDPGGQLRIPGLDRRGGLGDPVDLLEVVAPSSMQRTTLSISSTPETTRTGRVRGPIGR